MYSFAHYVSSEPLEVTVTKAVNTDDNTVIFTVTPTDVDRAYELKNIKLFAAEYDNGALTNVTIGTKSELSNNALTITAPLLSSQDYKYMLWDDNNSPLMNVITDINEEI